MKTGYVALFAAVAVAAIAIGAFAVVNDGESPDVTVADTYDPDEKLGDFDFVTGDDRIDIAPEVTLSSDISIDYFGDIKEWKGDPEVRRDFNMVIFSTSVYASPVDYVFVFNKVKEGSLKASLDGGIPGIRLKAQNGFSIELYYFDHKDDSQIQEYYTNVAEYTLKTNFEVPVYYGDSMFSVPSTERNPDMMMFALGLELCTPDTDGDRATWVLRLMRDMGYLNADTNKSYKEAPTIRSTDVAIGSKQWNGYNLILVMANGSNYSAEFAANVMLGPSGDHTGFTYACNEALDYLREFIKANGITGKTKILLTGYSRTAAGINLATACISDAIAEGKVSEEIGNVELTKEDVYGFTFETPLCGHPTDGHASPTDSRYDNIWYVINPEDPVTYLPPAGYGFIRFGHAVELPSRDEASRTEMLELVSRYFTPVLVPTYDLSEFSKVAGIENLKQLWEGFSMKFFDAVGDRQFYYDNIEADFVQFVYILLKDPRWMTDIMGGVTNILAFVMNLDKYSSDKTAFDEFFMPIIENSTKKYGYEEYSRSIVDSLYQLTNVVKRYAGGNMYSLLTDPYAQCMFTNYRFLIVSHIPTVTYCYLALESDLYR